MNATYFRQSWHIGTCLTVALALFTAAQVGAQVVVFDNLGSAPYGNDGYSTFGLYSDGYHYERGMQFTPSQTIKLSTLELALGEAYFPGGSAQSGTAQVQLMTDTNNAPATVLESWTSGTLSGYPGNASAQTFTSMQTPTLAAGSNYWIVLSDASGSSLGGAWPFADDQHTGNTLTMLGNLDTGGSPSYEELTRGFCTRVSGISLIAPSIYIARTATNTIAVSWPTSATGWVLEYTNSIKAASAPWPQLAPPYSSIGTNFFVTFTNSPAAGSQFFRLFNP
jgi:hypothetical protein